MFKKHRILVTSVVLIGIYFFTRAIVLNTSALRVSEETYECGASQCTYSFLVENRGHRLANGTVRVQAYEQGGIKERVKIGFDTVELSLKPSAKREFSGSFEYEETVDRVSFILSSN